MKKTLSFLIIFMFLAVGVYAADYKTMSYEDYQRIAREYAEIFNEKRPDCRWEFRFLQIEQERVSVLRERYDLVPLDKTVNRVMQDVSGDWVIEYFKYYTPSQGMNYVIIWLKRQVCE